MSADSESNEITIEDDEEYVDKKTKAQILNLRAAIDDDERRLYVDRLRNPELGYTRDDANRDWGISVRQYLRGIRRLWTGSADTGVKNVDHYWEDKEIVDEIIYPPDKNGFQFSMVEYANEYSDFELRQAIGLDRGVDIPKPYRFTLEGLSNVLDTKTIQHRWVIKTDERGPPPEHNTEAVSISAPLPKYVLEDAIETADMFLQQAGIGFNTTVDDYMAEDSEGL